MVRGGRDCKLYLGGFLLPDEGSKGYEIRTKMKNGTGAMTTAKDAVFIGL